MRDIITVHFPFIEKSEFAKPRPALVLTNSESTYQHVIIAYMTTQLDYSSNYCVVIDQESEQFIQTGLKYSTLIVLHKLYTIEQDLVKQKIGSLSEQTEEEVNMQLKKMFNI